MDELVVRLPSSARKFPGSPDRSVPLDYVLQRIPRLRKRFGITRIADISRLDRIEWPTITTIVPNSPDELGSYCGKGATYEAALVSAVMEAVERQVCARFEAPVVHLMPARELAKRFRLSEAGYVGSLDDEIPCLDAVSLLSGEHRFAPYELVRCPWPYRRQFRVVSTNGLAAGSTLAEAIHHAAFEIFERHAFAVAEAHASLLPRIIAGAAGADVVGRAALESDEVCGREISFPCGDDAIDGARDAIVRSGALVRVLYVERDGAVPFAVSTVWSGAGDEIEYHSGLGCALDPALAIRRALTEAVQSRLVNRSSIREDMWERGDSDRGFGTYVRRNRRRPASRWWFDLAAPQAALCELSVRSTDDLMQDLQVALTLLDPDSMTDGLFLPLTAGCDDVQVVRLLAPGVPQEPADVVRRFLETFRRD